MPEGERLRWAMSNLVGAIESVGADCLRLILEALENRSTENRVVRDMLLGKLTHQTVEEVAFLETERGIVGSARAVVVRELGHITHDVGQSTGIECAPHRGLCRACCVALKYVEIDQSDVNIPRAGYEYVVKTGGSPLGNSSLFKNHFAAVPAGGVDRVIVDDVRGTIPAHQVGYDCPHVCNLLTVIPTTTLNVGEDLVPLLTVELVSLSIAFGHAVYRMFGSSALNDVLHCGFARLHNLRIETERAPVTVNLLLQIPVTIVFPFEVHDVLTVPFF